MTWLQKSALLLSCLLSLGLAIIIGFEGRVHTDHIHSLETHVQAIDKYNNDNYDWLKQLWSFSVHVRTALIDLKQGTEDFKWPWSYRPTEKKTVRSILAAILEDILYPDIPPSWPRQPLPIPPRQQISPKLEAYPAEDYEPYHSQIWHPTPTPAPATRAPSIFDDVKPAPPVNNPDDSDDHPPPPGKGS